MMMTTIIVNFQIWNSYDTHFQSIHMTGILANTIVSPKVGSLLGQRRRRCANI